MMTSKIKTWSIGGISALIAYGSTLLSNGSNACIGTACASCPANCFSGAGIIWLMLLYLHKVVGVSSCPVVKAKWQTVSEHPAMNILREEK